jgi:hypothetical protein
VRLLGAATLLLALLHMLVHVLEGAPWDVLWACIVGAALAGLGLAVRSAWVCAVGAAWSLLGLPLWLVGLCTGGERLWATTLGTHVLGPIAGLVGVRALGVPRGAWLASLLGLVLLQHLCRLVTPPAANVNLAHAVYPGFEEAFPSYGLYFATFVVGGGGGFLLLELAARRLRPEPA